MSARGTGEVRILATAGSASGAAAITVALVQRDAAHYEYVTGGSHILVDSLTETLLVIPEVVSRKLQGAP